MSAAAEARRETRVEGTILERIVDDTRRRNSFERTIRPFPVVIDSCRSMPRNTGFPF